MTTTTRPEPKLYNPRARHVAVLGGVVLLHALGFWAWANWATVSIPAFKPMMVTVEAGTPAGVPAAPARIAVPTARLAPR